MHVDKLENAKDIVESFIEFMQKGNVPAPIQFINTPKRNPTIRTAGGGKYTKF